VVSQIANRNLKSQITQPDSGNPKYSEVFRSDPQSKNISRPNYGSKRAMKNDTYFLPTLNTIRRLFQ